MKKNLHLILLFLFIGNMGFAQTLLLQESFESDATNYDANTFSDGASDYFTVFNISSPPTGWPRAFSNVDGTYMFGAEDMDDVDNPLAPTDINGYIVISSQNIAAYDQVQVILALGAVYDGGSDVSFEEFQPDVILVQYAFDGNIATAGDANVNTGTYTTVGQFKGNDGDNATGLYEDTNLDGKGDGTLLTEAFQDFSYTINTNGATNVSIRIVIENDLSEEIGVDNIRVYGILTTAAPTVTTNAASSISASSATMGGNVTSNGGAAVSDRGVVYSTTDATPTIAEGATKDANGTGTGTFSESIGSLSANTTYYYNSYAINSEGTSYGTASSFTTLMNPPGNSLNFDGVDSNVTTTNILTIGSSSHTLEVWVKIPLVGTGNLDSGERVGVIFGNYDGINPSVVNYEIHDDGQVRWYIGGASQYGTQDLRDNKWHHLAFIRDKAANKLYIYIDGELELESASAGSDQVFSKAQIIGMDQRSPSLADTPYFHGEMDELRIWNDVRTIEEIRENMKDAIIGDEADLVSYYKFDHLSGSTLSDLTSNNNDGILQNMADEDWNSSGAMLYIPTAITETDITTNSFTANWEQNYTASKYYLDVSTVSDFSSYVTNYQNKEIIGQTTVSQSVTGLTSGTNYYYRIRAYNGSTTKTSANSNVIEMTVYSIFVVGSISEDQTICYSETPDELIGIAPTGGNTPYTYQWQNSIDGTNFSDISGATSLNYQAGALLVTTYYQLKQTSASCCGTLTTNIVTITGDIVDPIITSTHSDKEVDAGSDCTASLLDYTGGIVATDNCDADLTVTQLPIAGTTISGATNAITLTVTDDAGNTADISFNVAVVDNTNPVITSTHSDRSVFVTEFCESVLPNYTRELVATDNCDDHIVVTQSPLAGTIIFGEVNTVTLIASDDAGNRSSTSFNVSVIDNIIPIITTSHRDVTVDADENCQALLPDFRGDVVATDNCDSDLFVYQSHVPGKVIWGAVNTVTLSIVDDAGNSTHVRFNVAVVDNTDPIITCIEDQIVDANGTEGFTVSGLMFDPVSTEDNCGVAGIENDFNHSATLDGAVFPLGTTTVTWTVFDETGNTAYCSFDVTVMGTLGINSLEDNGVLIYPNPTQGRISLEFTNSKKRKIKILDLTGRVVLTKTIETIGETFDLSSFDSGVYVISVQEDNKTFTTRIVKQ